MKPHALILFLLSLLGAERIANARAYMQTLFAQGIELRPDTTATFVTNAGNSYDELQWQCVEDDLAWDITLQCDSDLLLTTSHSDSIFIDTISSGIYYYYTDHLGSASWITEGEEPVQYIHYMPYGELWCNQRNTTYDERYKFTGKERDAETGYDFFGARSYSSAITSWLSVDPLSDKYPSISPYAYCSWNPVKYIDPDGKIAIAANVNAQTRLLSTLSCPERRYVSFDKNGKINVRRINQCQSTSHNMTALKALASSEVTYNFLVQGKSSNGETDMKQAGGVTEMYGLDKDASPDPSIVNIISGDHLQGEAAARNMAHEAFVHAYLYETNGHDGRAAGHQRPNLGAADGGTYIDPDTGIEYPSYDINFMDHPNDKLNQYDMKAQNEASANYNCGL